jgi:hypothetical protein|tara:strand:- start:4131 stop:5072 length:942 start_codon:yes stop_codon:yes gene_type:complete
MKTKLLLFMVCSLFNGFLLSESNTSGKVFYDYTRDLDDGSNAFNIKRGYLTFVNNLDETLMYKLTYDMGSNDAGSAYTAFLKTAMVKYKTPLVDVTLGMQPMNMYKTMENTWGHRFISKGSMGAYRFSSSADIGIRFARKFDQLSTSLMITNGGGYKKSEEDNHKKVSLHAVYGQSKLNKSDGFNVGGSFSFEPYDADDSEISNINVIGIFVGYAGQGFRGGLELDTKKDRDISGRVISMYGTYALSDKTSILGRLDQIDLNTSNPGDGVKTIIAGLHHFIGKGVIIAPNVRISKTERGDPVNVFVLNFEFKF